MAQALVAWLPRVLPLVETWMSEKIPAGTEWRTMLMDALRKCEATIACVTPENLRSQWLNFEAGAAAITAPDYRLFPLFLGSDALPSGPLSGLQVMRCSESDIRHLVKKINSLCDPKCLETWVDAQFDLLWKELEKNLDVTSSSWVDYDEAIKSIREHLSELERRTRVNVITFYVRDDATPRDDIDFYIEATHGLRDPAPMYGPIVFDDERKTEFSEPDSFNGDLTQQLPYDADKVEGRATSFIGREKIRAKATFRHLDSYGVKALLYLNWRKAQTFSDEDKVRLREDAAAVFALLPRRPSISLERSRLLTKELRARRYLGSAELDGISLSEKIDKVLTQFFAPDAGAVDFEIFSLEEHRAVKGLPGDDHRPECPIDSNWRWVQKTTKPLFLKSEGDPSTIIVAMRLPPNRKECRQIIVINEHPSVPNFLRSDMVRPLCSLADTFAGMLS